VVLLPGVCEGPFRWRITSILLAFVARGGEGGDGGRSSETGIFASRNVPSLGEGPRQSESAV
jgi:hypothetical protein